MSSEGYVLLALACIVSFGTGVLIGCLNSLSLKAFFRNIKNLYIIIVYFGFGYLDAIYYTYKQDKDLFEDFWECLQEELYAIADSQ